MKSAFIKTMTYTIILSANTLLADTNKHVPQERLINAVKYDYNELKDAKIIAKRIDYSGDYAYFCGIGLERRVTEIGCK